MVSSQTLVTTVTAVDPDPGRTLDYAITGGTARLFDFVGGNLLTSSPPDLSDLPPAGATPGYEVTVSVADESTPSRAQQLTVWVSPNPVLTPAASSYEDAIGGGFMSTFGADRPTRRCRRELLAGVPQPSRPSPSIYLGVHGRHRVGVRRPAGWRTRLVASFGLGGDDLIYGSTLASGRHAAAWVILEGEAGSNALYGGSAFNTFVHRRDRGRRQPVWGAASLMTDVMRATPTTPSPSPRWRSAGQASMSIC